jgi:glucosamine--fructose-6-phosphate aminotransferase (isomerizing)
MDIEEQYCEKDGREYLMIDEIVEEPQAVRKAIIQDKQSFTLIAMDILRARQVVITACGTSRYAALVGRYLFSDVAKKFCDVVMASEFHYFSESVDKNTLVIAVSQGDETSDVIEGIQRAKANGAHVISIVNTRNSLLCRMSHDVIFLNCGLERTNVATKSMVSQLAVFYLLALDMVNRFDWAVSSLEDISEKIAETLSRNEMRLEELANSLKDSKDFYCIARGINFPIAYEAALKFKEMSCIHAEGLPAGELKHGTLALIDKGVPVVAICPDDSTFQETLSNVMEAKARGATIIGVSDRYDKLYDSWIEIPKLDAIFYPLICIAPLHLLAYYLAAARGESPDRSRSLARSLTV